MFVIINSRMIDKCLTSFLLALIIPLLGYGQTITVSEEIQLKNDIAYEIIGEYKGRTLLFRDRNNSFEVFGFNERMHQIWDKELIIEKRNPRLIDVAPGNDDFVVVYEYREDGRQVVQANKYDPAAEVIDTLIVGDVGSAFTSPPIDLAYSDDERKLLLFYSDQPSEVQLILVDLDSMVILWEGLLQPPDFNFDRDFLQAVVSNIGDVYLTFNKNNFRSKRKDHEIEIWRVGQSTGAPEPIDISLGDRVTFDAYFTFDNLNNQVLGVGLWSESNTDKATGYYFLRVPFNGSSDQVLSYNVFPQSFLAAFHGKEVKSKRGINEASLQDIVVRRDGGVILIGERNRVFDRFSGTPSRFAYDNFGRVSTDYYYEDLFVMSIHPDGKLHWSSVLPKKQYSQNDNGIFSSFFLFKTSASLRLIFNDEIKWENTVSEYVLTGSGKTDRNSILSTKNLELKLRLRDAIQVAGDEMIIPSERRNKLKLVRLVF